MTEPKILDKLNKLKPGGGTLVKSMGFEGGTALRAYKLSDGYFAKITRVNTDHDGESWVRLSA